MSLLYSWTENSHKTIGDEPFNWRICKEIGTSDTQYLYDGNNPIRALDGVGQSKAELIMGLTSHQFLRRITDGVPYCFLCDQLPLCCESWCGTLSVHRPLGFGDTGVGNGVVRESFDDGWRQYDEYSPPSYIA